jgi:hypothetical protein
MAHFPDTPSFTGFNTPSRIEADIVNLMHHRSDLLPYVI